VSDPLAHAAVRALAIVAMLVVLARNLAGVRGRRTLAATGWQYVWLLYLVDYTLVWRHPVVIDAPAWYDVALRPFGLALMLAGIALVAWAYATMGGYWSASISMRDDHRLVQAGPFALVRHPVYAGFLLGLFGGALALADPLVALAAIASVPIMRGRAFAEERFLETRLGDAYRDYRRRVRMFVPGLF
jgi:protein-S-isoprenylcysteine O-methyltransferase Ste14